MDLGADGWQTFRFVIWPVISTALVAGGLLAFALSFDEVIVTTFTAGRAGDAADLHPRQHPAGPAAPVVNVVAFVVIVLTVDPGRDRAAPDARHGSHPARRGEVTEAVEAAEIPAV